MEVTGWIPEWLYFDSKLTPYVELSEFNFRDTFFVTIRRRESSLLKRLDARPKSYWTSV